MLWRFVSLTAACLLISSVSSSLAESKASSEPIKIGVIQSLTGAASYDGTTVVRSLHIAEDRLKKNGVPVSLIIEDDGSDPKSAVSAFRKLKWQGVDAVIGGTWSTVTNTLASLAASEELVVFNTSTLPEGLNYSSSGGYLFSNALALDPEAAPFGGYLKRRRFASAVLIQNGSPWGDAQAEKYHALLDTFDVRLLRSFRGNKTDDNEWDSVFPLIKSLAPDLIIILSGKKDTELILRRARELAVKASFFSSKNVFDAWRLSSQKEIYSSSVCFTYPWAQLRASQDLTAEYMKRFGEEAPMYSDSSFDSLFILTKAVIESRAAGKDLRTILKTEPFVGLTRRYEYSERSSMGGGSSSLVCFADEKPQFIE